VATTPEKTSAFCSGMQKSVTGGQPGAAAINVTDEQFTALEDAAR
jgi:hypothetical protein